MRILRHYREPPPEARGAVAALGNFDGVHRGHQALIAEASRVAGSLSRPLAVLVFEPYPREFFRPQDPPFRLTTFRAKAHLLSGLGVNFLIVLTFDAAMAGKLAQDFVFEVLVEGLKIAHVVVGADFRFGKGRGGDGTVLAYMGEMEGFGVTLFNPIVEAGAKISSTEIRAALRAGHPGQAAHWLGHWWRVEGRVASGDKRGRKLGFPTANLKLERTLAPAYGVYAVRVRRQGESRQREGIANFGIRPMFALPAPLLEVHLFDFSGDLYGEMLEVELIDYIRAEQMFAGEEALRRQMQADAERARRILAAAGEGPPDAPMSTGCLGRGVCLDQPKPGC